MTPDLIGAICFVLIFLGVFVFVQLDGRERLRQRTINRKGQRVRREL